MSTSDDIQEIIDLVAAGSAISAYQAMRYANWAVASSNEDRKKQSIEERIAALERQVEQLSSNLQVMKDRGGY